MKKLIPLALCLIALPAAAHPGHAEASGLLAGLAHPFTGLDHLLALLGVGLWSRQQWQQQRRGMLVPAAFLLMMALGALVRVDVPIELGIAASVVLIGALLASALRVPTAAAIGLAGLFALLHGQAHGRELAGMASMAGFLASSAVLLMAGRAIDSKTASRIAGAAIGAAGLYLLAATA